MFALDKYRIGFPLFLLTIPVSILIKHYHPHSRFFPQNREFKGCLYIYLFIYRESELGTQVLLVSSNPAMRHICCLWSLTFEFLPLSSSASQCSSVQLSPSNHDHLRRTPPGCTCLGLLFWELSKALKRSLGCSSGGGGGGGGGTSGVMVF